MKNNFLNRYLPLYLRGIVMGAADIVPGVSGGTVAFITGIYEELIGSLKSIDVEAAKTLFTKGPKAFWAQINGNFLLAIFGGVLTSVFSMVKLIHYLLHEHPVLIWSFFFGLIVASAVLIAFKIPKWSWSTFGMLLIGAGIALWITLSGTAQTPDGLWFVFLSGAIAICAMILPGISGSFILLLMQKYEFITAAVKDLNIVVILTFLGGCVIGLVSFSKLLSFMFKRFHDATIALMTGFMLGSLNVVWPWKKVVETRLDSHGEEVPFRYASQLPQHFEGDAQLFAAIAAMVGGFVLIWFLEKLGEKKSA